MGRVRYIGSKARIVQEIVDLAGPPGEGRFVDAFCGTGVVSRAAARAGWRVLANDHLLSASVAAHAQLLSVGEAPFRKLGGYQSVVEQLNALLGTKGFFFREYSPSGKSRTGESRRYFTVDNAMRIDAIRKRIREWGDAGLLSVGESRLLLADLMEAANRVANIAGTYGCFLSRWTAGAERSLALSCRQLLSRPAEFKVTTEDVATIRTNPDDLVYMDPPYTKRQYASYYHILETLAHGDEPLVEGVSGLRPWADKASPFCYKRRALPALISLCDRLPSSRLLISYNCQGHIPIEEMESGLATVGRVTVHEVARIGRYRPNAIAMDNGAHVTEFVFEIEKHVTRQGANRRRSRVNTLWSEVVA